MQKSNPISIPFNFAGGMAPQLVGGTEAENQMIMTQSFASSGRLAFKELELLKYSTSNARSALSELQTRTLQFRALRDHIRLAFKPFRDFLRSVATVQKDLNARVMCLLICERTIQFSFRTIFCRHCDGRSEVQGFTSANMSQALMANGVNPVLFEVAFAAVKAGSDITDPEELKARANERIASLRVRRTKYVQAMGPALQLLNYHIADNWTQLYEICRQFVSLSEIADELQQVISTSRSLSLQGSSTS